MITTSKKHVNYLLIFLVIITLPILLMCFFVHPWADDWSFVGWVQDLGLIQAQLQNYYTRFGRITSTFIISLSPLNFKSFIGHQIYILFWILFFIGSIYIFIKTVLSSYLSRKQIFAGSLIFFLVYCSGMPQISTGLYWLSSSATYLISSSFLLLWISSLYLFFTTNNKVSSVAAIIFLFLMMTSSEILMALGFIFSFLILILTIYFRKHIKFSIFQFFVSLFGLLLVFLSPGNTVRQSDVLWERSQNIFVTIISSTAQSLKYIIEWISHSPLILFCALYGFVSYKLLSQSNSNFLKKISGRHLIIYGVFFYGTILLTYIPAYWTLGSRLPDRAMNVTFFLFILGLLFFTTLFVAYLINGSQSNKQYLIPNKIKYLVVVLTLLSIAGSSNYKLLLKDQLSLKAYRFHLEMLQRYSIIEKSETKNVVLLPELKNYPMSIIPLKYQLTDDENHWRNQFWSRFWKGYKLKLIQD